MSIIVRALMWAHYIYLLSLPTLAVVSAQMMFPGSDLLEVLLIVGFPCVLMYTLFLANGYALPDSLPVALIVTLAIPLQIALSVFLFGQGSLWLFFAESATIEINSFVFGTLSVAVYNRGSFHFKTSIFIFGLIMMLFGGGLVAYISLVFYGYGGFSAWLILFVSSFAVAFWEYAKVYKKTVDSPAHIRGETEEIVMKFDSPFLSRILGIEENVPLISPLRSSSERNSRMMSTPILIFGFTAMFLPLVITMILEIAFG